MQFYFFPLFADTEPLDVQQKIVAYGAMYMFTLSL